MKVFQDLKKRKIKTLGVCAPSARFNRALFESALQKIKKKGFEVKIPDPIFLKKRYLAGEDGFRAEVINQLFSDSDIDAVICARGGYGAMRILDFIDWGLIKNNPKPFIGFSDVTSLLLTIISKSGIPVIHGPTLTSLASASKQTIDSFFDTLGGNVSDIQVSKAKIAIPGKCSGILKGGNLSTISHLIGTPFQPEFNGGVLFLEDTGEPAYKIDRMLTQMQMSGLFEGLQGVITGTFEQCDNENYLEEIFIEIFEKYNIPVLTGLQCGHGRINLSLIMGAQVQMDTETLMLSWK